MLPPSAVAEEILCAAARALKSGDRVTLGAIDELPVAVYATDLDGFLTYYNPHCIIFAGRTPLLGRDRWCVTWKLYTEAGVFLPHAECPMALSVQGNVAVRGARAVAERPDGIRVEFMPFPTPIRKDDGTPLGAVNMLIDLTEREQAMFDSPYSGDFEYWQRTVIERVLGTFSIVEVRALVHQIEAEVSAQRPRMLH